MKKALFVSLILLAGFSIATAQISLSFNPAKGSKYQYTMEMNQHIKQKVLGQEIPMTQKMVAVYDMVIQEKNASEIKASFMYSEVLYDLSSAMMNMKYDSKNPSASTSEMDAMMAKIFGGIIGKPFQVVIAPNGEVKSVSGLDAIVDDMMKTMGNDNQAQMIGQSLKQQLSDEAMKTMLEQSMKIYPDKAVKPNETWNINQTLGSMGMAMNVKSVYTLKSADKKTALVDVTSTIDGMDGKLSGTQSGTIEFDLKSGLPKLSDITQDIKGNITAQGMDVEMVIDSKVKVTTMEIK